MSINLINNIIINRTSSIINEIKKYSSDLQIKQEELENKIKSKEKLSEFVIDRFEGEFAVCERISDNKVINIKKEILPLNIKEGNVIKYNGSRYIIDFKKSILLNKKIKKITDNLWEN